MSIQFPFPHDGYVYVLSDDRFEVAYYSRGYRKFKRVREIGLQNWNDTLEQEIDRDLFWFVVACVERAVGARRGVA